jgi:hypothetical protein
MAMLRTPERTVILMVEGAGIIATGDPRRDVVQS